MAPLCFQRRALTIAALLALAAQAFASPNLTEKQAAQARQLVQQLGSRSFRDRDDASGKLVRMGSAVEAILREGMTSPDPEVRLRCHNILPMARAYDLERRLIVFLDGKVDRDYPPPECWDKFKDMVGDSRSSRQLFANMHRLDNEFLRMLEDKPSELEVRMNHRCSEFVQSQNWGSGFAGTSQIALLLFASLEPKLSLEVNMRSMFSGALASFASRQRGKELLNSELIRKLMIKYVADGGNDADTSIRLGIVATLNLKEAVDFVKSVMKDSHKSQPYYSAIAMSVLGKIGGKANADDILAYIKDDTVVTSMQVGNLNITTQIRDVALANLILVSEQKLRDYDFPYLKSAQGRNFPAMNVVYLPLYLGFGDETERSAAFVKWDDWYKKNKSALAK